MDSCKERVRRVIEKMTHAKAPRRKEETPELDLGGSARLREFSGDLGFRVFKLAESNFAIWNPALAATDPEKLAEQCRLSADNVSADTSEQALLYELLLARHHPGPSTGQLVRKTYKLAEDGHGWLELRRRRIQGHAGWKTID